jgi:hypothetical protein
VSRNPRKPKEPERYSVEWIQEFDKYVYRLTLLHGEWHNVDAYYPRVGDSIPAEQMVNLIREVRKNEQKKRGGPMEEIVLSEESRLLLERRMGEGCVCCGYILMDSKKNVKLTDYPGNYPVEAKIEHVSAEKSGQVA